MWRGFWVCPWNGVIKTTVMSHKIVIKYDYLQYFEISSNTALLEFGLAKSNLRQSFWLKVKFKVFHFTLPFFQALFKRWINNKIKFVLFIFTSYFLSCSVVPYYTQLNETLWDHGGSNPYEIPWISNAKAERWFTSSRKPWAAGNMHVSVFCQIDVVINQLVSPLCWNSPLSGTSSRKSYILTIYKHRDAKEKIFLDDQGIYNFMSKITYL